MAMVHQESGCKVGWEWYDNENEAAQAAQRALGRAARKAAQGYDFGYSMPGEVQYVAAHPEHGEYWRVTIP